MSEHSYRLFIQTNDGQLIVPASSLKADDDGKAIEESLKLANGLYAELHDDKRLIVKINERH